MDEYALRFKEFDRLKSGGCAWPRDALLEDTSLTRGTLNLLRRNDLHTVGDVLALTSIQLFGIKNFGVAAFADLCQGLASPLHSRQRRTPIPYQVLRSVELIEEYAEILPEELLERLRIVVGRTSGQRPGGD